MLESTFSKVLPVPVFVWSWFGQAFTGHHAVLTRLIKVHDAREGQLQKLQVSTNAHCSMQLISGNDHRKLIQYRY